jgi:phosphoenolpyruvate carboxylase
LFDADRKIPRTMATQHPDNVNVPEWSSSDVIDGNTEVYEAFHAYQILGCQEVMWDSEGKDADTRVIRKLLSKHWEYFASHTIGEDIFLTYRLPNPKIEAVERKYIVETLQNIPVAYDVASTVYKREVTPLFEVILPFTTDSKELIMLRNYYEKAIVADEEEVLFENFKVADWIGSFKPKKIKIIPLVEDFSSILNIDKIIKPYISLVKPNYLRAFIARSDPALNYGLISAVILTKIGLSKLKKVEEETNVKIYPILGVGSKPFRGHLSPDNVDAFLQEYKGLSTVTVQSAARYDYPIEQVKQLVRTLNDRLLNNEPIVIDSDEENSLVAIMLKCRTEYEQQIELLAPFVNSVAAYVPQRRARKLHVGLFGYSRNVGGISLPRAITFAAALYSVGIPPEFIGMKAIQQLSDEELSILKKYYVNIKRDLDVVGGYFSCANINMLAEMTRKTAEKTKMNEVHLHRVLRMILEDFEAVEDVLGVKLGPKTCMQRKHENFTNNFLLSYLECDESEAKKALIESAKIRKCLG